MMIMVNNCLTLQLLPSADEERQGTRKSLLQGIRFDAASPYLVQVCAILVQLLLLCAIHWLLMN